MPSSQFETRHPPLFPRCLRVSARLVLLLVRGRHRKLLEYGGTFQPARSSIASSGGASANRRGKRLKRNGDNRRRQTSTGGTVLTGGVATTAESAPTAAALAAE